MSAPTDLNLISEQAAKVPFFVHFQIPAANLERCLTFVVQPKDFPQVVKTISCCIEDMEQKLSPFLIGENLIGRVRKDMAHFDKSVVKSFKEWQGLVDCWKGDSKKKIVALEAEIEDLKVCASRRTDRLPTDPTASKESSKHGGTNKKIVALEAEIEDLKASKKELIEALDSAQVRLHASGRKIRQESIKGSRPPSVNSSKYNSLPPKLASSPQQQELQRKGSGLGCGSNLGCSSNLLRDRSGSPLTPRHQGVMEANPWARQLMAVSVPVKQARRTASISPNLAKPPLKAQVMTSPELPSMANFKAGEADTSSEDDTQQEYHSAGALSDEEEGFGAGHTTSAGGKYMNSKDKAMMSRKVNPSSEVRGTGAFNRLKKALGVMGGQKTKVQPTAIVPSNF
jgi:hypothetical protein